MKQFLITLILIMLLSSQTATACCAGDYVGMFPRSSYISSNSSFLIDFSESDFNLKNKLSDLRFTAVTTNGKHFELNVLETNFSGSLGQVFLKANTTLKMGDSISIEVSSIKGDTLDDRTKKFSSIVNYKKWVVKYEADNESPKWTADSISYTIRDSRNASTRGYSIILKPTIIDNSKAMEKDKEDKNSPFPLFYEIKFNNQKFICAFDNSDAQIYSSGCGDNFNFDIGETYTATLKVIDSSGNYSTDTKTVSFTTIDEWGNR